MSVVTGLKYRVTGAEIQQQLLKRASMMTADADQPLARRLRWQANHVDGGGVYLLTAEEVKELEFSA